MSNTEQPPYTPANETTSQIWIDEAVLDGDSIGFVAYGVHVTLFFLCFNLLWSSRKKNPANSYSFLAYISVVFVLGSIGVSTDMHLNQVAYVDNRTYPNGPGTYEKLHNSLTYNVVGTAAYVVNSWLQDGLLLYRFYIMWNAYWWMIIIPMLNFLVTIIMSCILIAQLAQPGRTLWESSSANLALTYWSTSIATTLLLTVLIVGRLLYLRRQIHKTMGNQHQVPYLSVSTMLIESACLYSVWALVFIITYARKNTVNNLVFQSLGQVQSIAPLLIILRVAQGRAWTKAAATDTLAMASGSMQFAPRSIALDGTTTATIELGTFGESATRIMSSSRSAVVSQLGDAVTKSDSSETKHK